MSRTIIFSFLICFPLKAQEVELVSSNLPVVIIDTNGQAIPSDNPRAIADMRIIFNEDGGRNDLSDPSSHYSGKISIETRGESSAGWDIKSYSFETQNEDGSNRNVPLLNLPKENDWILHAPFFDRSLMRNVLSYYLAREMGWYASRTRYCEVILNDEYIGIYVLMEKIKQGKDRIDIANLNPDEIEGDDVTGGYILRVDKEAWSPGFDSSFPPNKNTNSTVRYQYFHPKGDEIVSEQETYIQEYLYDFEEVMHDEEYADPISGYEAYLNSDSFVDYIILNELSRNVDGYRLSSYLTKPKESDGGKLIAGPVWDYNFSYGNVGYYNAGLTSGWQILFFAENASFHLGDSFQMPFWWEKLFNNDRFARKLNTRWKDLRQNILSEDSLNATIDRFANSLYEAKERNFEVRPKPGSTNLGGGWFPFDPRSNQIDSYEDEIIETKNWLSTRMNWMDSNMPLLTSIADEFSAIPDSYELKQNYPNPFNPSTNISFNLPTSTFVRLTVFNVQGQRIQQLVNTRMSTGKHQVKFRAGNLASGIYFYTLETEDVNLTRKMLLTK